LTFCNHQKGSESELIFIDSILETRYIAKRENSSRVAGAASSTRRERVKKLTKGMRVAPPNTDKAILAVILALLTSSTFATMFGYTIGDPSLQDNLDGTTTATWSFQNPANYTFNNVSVLANNVTLQRGSSGFKDTLQSDFQQGTVILNMDVANDPGNVTLMNTDSAGTPQWINSSITAIGGKDAYLNAGSPDNNYGLSANVNAEPVDQKRPIVEFNLTPLQTYDLIISALLSLKLENSNSADPLNVSVHQVNASWLEGTGDDSVTNDGVTYTSRDGSVSWTSVGGDFNPVPEDIVYSIRDQPTWYTWDISRLFVDWMNGTKPNYGVIFNPLEINPPINEKFFSSKESPTPGARPKLQLNYLAQEGGLANGTFVSRVLDAGFLVNWGNISWNSTVPGQTNMTLETRSGDCSGSWSAWSAAYASPVGSQITSPPNQCIQYKVEMETLNRTKAPILEEVRIDHRAYTSEGHIETEDFAPVNWVGWETFNANENAQPGSNVTYWFSTDSGVSWTEIFAGSNLQSIPDPAIRFRANLTTSNPMLSPILLNMSVTYQFFGSLDHIHMAVPTWTGTTDEWVDLDAIGHDVFHHTTPFIEKWETDDPWGSVDALGVYNPGRVGTWRVYCNNTGDTISNYTLVNVQVGNATNIGINPWDPGTMTTDDVQLFNSIAYDSKGNAIGPIMANWSVSGGIGTIPSGPSSSASFDPTTPGLGTVNADDGNGHTNSTNIIQVVAGILDRIVVQPDNITIPAGDFQNFTATGYDLDGNVVALIGPSWTTNAGNITSSSSTSATLKAQDTENLNGWISVIAVSQGNIAGSANLEVLEINVVPTILGTIPDQTKTEDYGPWSLDLSSYASDPQDSLSDLTWSFTGHDPSLTTINGDDIQGNHLITFTTVPNAYGLDELTIWLRDSDGYADVQTLYVTITSVNDRPTIQSITPFTVHFDEPYTYYFYDYVQDVETAKENLDLTSDDPEHILFNGQWGTFLYPEALDGTTVYPIVTVHDEDGGQMSTVLAITVSDDYVPVLVQELPDVVLFEGQEVKDHFNLDDYFDDPDEDSLFYTAGNVHTEITIHENHSVDFKAQEDWNGVETVSFRGIDPENARAEDIILVTVIPINDPPTISGVPDLTVHYEDPSRPFYNYTFDLAPYINDVDNATSGLIITTSDATHIFFNSSVNTVMEIHYPESMSGQTVTVRITVSDGLSNGYQDVNITVLDDWPPEIVSIIRDYSFFEDTSLPDAFNIADCFADNDADVLTFSSVSSNVTVAINSSTSLVSFSSTQDWFGNEYVTFRATDPDGAISEQTAMVTVIPVNDAPEILDIPDMTIQKGQTYTLDLGNYVFDIDNELSDLTILVTGDHPKTTVILAGSILILDYPFEGTDNIQIDVSDGDKSAYSSFNITIVGEPEPSVWDQMYWPWSVIVVLLLLVIFFLFSRGFFSRIHVDEAFLIYRNGSLIHHAVVGEQTNIDEDIFSNMLTAIQEFIRDSFKEMEDSPVKQIEFGERKIALERGEHLFLAVVYQGRETRWNLEPISEAIEEIEDTYAAELENWDGFVQRFDGVHGILCRHLVDLKKTRGTENIEHFNGNDNDGNLKESSHEETEGDDSSQEGSL
jgi:hypothetical protein